VPVYEYHCKGCGANLELSRAIPDRPLAPACEVCGRSMERVWTPVGIVFKGSGWTTPKGGSG